MNVVYSERVKQPGNGYVLLQEATKVLDAVLGQSSSPVSAEWDYGQDERGRPRFRLTLSDFSGRVSADFTPSELRSAEQLRRRLVPLWGDLLQIRSHELL